jgi:hypothetical protein
MQVLSIRVPPDFVSTADAILASPDRPVRLRNHSAILREALTRGLADLTRDYVPPLYAALDVAPAPVPATRAGGPEGEAAGG